VQGIKADPVDQLRSAGRIVTPAEYKIFLDAMQTKETRIVAFPGETAERVNDFETAGFRI